MTETVFRDWLTRAQKRIISKNVARIKNLHGRAVPTQVALILAQGRDDLLNMVNAGFQFPQILVTEADVVVEDDAQLIVGEQRVEPFFLVKTTWESSIKCL